MHDDVKLGCVGVIICAFLMPFIFGGCYGCSKVQTSDGFRDSTVRKISESGVVFRTWEVEGLGDGLRMSDNRMSPETFQYSVSDPAVVKQLQSLPPGKRVRIHYRKMLAAWVPSGESQYFIAGIDELP